MALPQPQRPFGTEGKKPTHDFLSLYNNDSSFKHEDPRSTQGFYLKTQDFIQPLERVRKSKNKGEGSVDQSSGRTSVEHVLPGGIGTCSINHISDFNQGGGKPEKKVNINNSSYTGSAFTLWGESIRMESRAMADNLGERQSMGGRLAASIENFPFLTGSCFIPSLGDSVVHLSPLSTDKVKVTQSNQGFMDMIKSVKGESEDDEDEEEYLDRNRDNKEGSSQRGDAVPKVDGKSNDQKATALRSKHSATEQRRRSKINDRFLILRQLVPHSDVKRDKASLLLEVIEYIQLLQGKVQKYEASFQGWNQDKVKMMAWENSHGLEGSAIDHSRVKNSPGPGFIFAGKFDGNSTVATPALTTNFHKPPESNNTDSVVPYKAKEHHSSLPSRAVHMHIPLQPCIYNRVPSSSLAQPQQRLRSDANIVTQPQPQFQQRPWPADHPIQSSTRNEQEELAVEGGVISISSLYSQGRISKDFTQYFEDKRLYTTSISCPHAQHNGMVERKHRHIMLLGTLTRALQSSGLDLSQASISVQIDLGKRAISRPSSTTSSAKDYEDPSFNNHAVARSRAASNGGDSEQARKRPKTGRDN